ncbi:adenylate kinase isoenzyme 1-like isoform X2 [Paramacrobiotus metropolitanus]|uniref:adenylate kinase isoenzyme 1-like isoform X2 n=1 Tax=Paramacrobiotus metropolitanus TaxID=2943436 RepID=UPI00244609EE|nr:adenylate kinase isoenzyme 1-like isoform X2 [Paramacrobiotus metropolitanus]
MNKYHPDDGNEHFKLVDLQWVRSFNPPVIFVFGGPGAGKASMCFKFRIHYGVSYFSMGQLLREEAREPTKRGREIAKYVHSQPTQKVPLELVMDVLRDMMIKLVAAQKPIFVQGFPRDFAQAVQYEKEIAPLKHAIFVDTTEKTAIQRLVNRNKLAGRFEDEVNVVRLRREAFQRDVLPIVENLLNEGRVQKVIIGLVLLTCILCNTFSCSAMCSSSMPYKLNKSVDGNGSMQQTYLQALEVYIKWMRRHWKHINNHNARLDESNPNYAREIIMREQTASEKEAEKSFPTTHYIGPLLH